MPSELPSANSGDSELRLMFSGLSADMSEADSVGSDIPARTLEDTKDPHHQSDKELQNESERENEARSGNGHVPEDGNGLEDEEDPEDE